MTTIVYRDGIIACDSQVTVGEVKYARMKKIRKLPNGNLIGICGDGIAGYRLMQMIEGNGGEPTQQIIEAARGAAAIYVTTDKTVWTLVGGKNGGLAPMIGPFFADGSGYVAALAAMKAGANAVQAVTIATELDTFSSPPIYTEKLGDPPPKKRTAKKRTKKA